MNLRIPGASASSGRRVAHAVGQHLADSVPSGLPGAIGDLSVRVPLARGASEAETTQAIVEAIGRALRGSRHG